MSREIKFRAWVESLKKYCSVQSIEFDWEGNIDEVWAYVEENVQEPFYAKEVILEQYTGLKDKNGKEIYEGDIVKFADLELAMKPAGVVCFSDGKFFIKDWEFDDGSYHIVDFYDYNIPYRDFEVIGNIHENPELLEYK